MLIFIGHDYEQITQLNTSKKNKELIVKAKLSI